MQRRWHRADVEPSLEEAMSDPMVHLVMRRDRLTPAEVWVVVDAARRRLGQEPAPSTPVPLAAGTGGSCWSGGSDTGAHGQLTGMPFDRRPAFGAQ